MADVFSLTQILGYTAFILGVLAFLQKDDAWFKAIAALECAVYAVHFHRLGNDTAAILLLVSVLRNVFSIYTRSRWVAGFFVLIGIVSGAWLARHWYASLPIFAQFLTTLALFFMTGVMMRIACGIASLCWLFNNILSGSIGGIILELFIQTANTVTIVRMLRNKKKTSPAGEVCHVSSQTGIRGCE